MAGTAWTNDPQEEMPGMHMDLGGMTSCEAFQTACSTKLKHTDLRQRGGGDCFVNVELSLFQACER